MSFLVARPLAKANSTCSALLAAGYTASIAPVIKIDISGSDILASKLKQSAAQIIIITSTYAIDWLSKQALTIDFNKIDVVCIGKSSAKHLQDLGLLKNGVKSLVIPKQENSEGALQLSILQNVSGKNVLILKGEGGRNLLAQALRERGAVLSELCVYKRSLNKIANVNNDYKLANIQCIIITSVEIAQAVFSLYDRSWLQNLTWMVASRRIKDYAIQQGVISIIESQGASIQAIVNCASQLVQTGVVND